MGIKWSPAGSTGHLHFCIGLVFHKIPEKKGIQIYDNKNLLLWNKPDMLGKHFWLNLPAGNPITGVQVALV